MIDKYKEKKDTEEIEPSELEKEVGEKKEPLKESERDIGFAKAFEALDKISEKRLKNLPKEKRQLHVWWYQNRKGEWELSHTKPKNLKDELLERGASIDDKVIRYKDKDFRFFASFDYIYGSGDKDPSNERKYKRGDSVRVNKYSLTPNADEETKDKKGCDTRSSKDLTQRT